MDNQYSGTFVSAEGGRKKTSRIPLIIGVCAAAVAAAGVILFFALGGTRLFSKVNEIDMTNPKADKNYGAMYFSPAPDENVKAIDDASAYVDNEILIAVKDGTARSDVEALAKNAGAEIVGEIALTGDYQLRFGNPMTLEELNEQANRLLENDLVVEAAPNFAFADDYQQYGVTAEGIHYGEQWAADLQDPTDMQGISWGLEAVNAPAAWSLLAASPSTNPVRLGLIDNGFDVRHEDLKSQYAEVFFDAGHNGMYAGDTDHGTHVSGTMAAAADNDAGICGVYPYGNGRLYAVSNCAGQGAIRYNSSLAAEKLSLAELIVRNVKVINSSRGACWSDYEDLAQWYTDFSDDHFSYIKYSAEVIGGFLDRMLNKGYDFVIVCSAGNDSYDLPTPFESEYNSTLTKISKDQYPAVYDRIIVVGALGFDMERASYSNAGNRVDVFAPGGDGEDGTPMIYSTLPGSQYGSFQGTSMASPHVAGVAAMVWAANNNLTGAQVKNCVCMYGNPVCTGYKLVDAAQAVGLAQSAAGLSGRSDPNNGSVVGYVYDQRSYDAPIVGATVSLFDRDPDAPAATAVTDDDGHFELIAPAGTYGLKILTDGYEAYYFEDIHESDFAGITSAPAVSPVQVDAQQVLELKDIFLRPITAASVTLPRTPVTEAPVTEAPPRAPATTEPYTAPPATAPAQVTQPSSEPYTSPYTPTVTVPPATEPPTYAYPPPVTQAPTAPSEPATRGAFRVIVSATTSPAA